MRYLMLLLITLLGAACTIEQTNEKDEDEMVMHKTGWSQSGNLTQQVPRSVKSVTCQADFHEPGNYTAQFRLGGNVSNKHVEAEIFWSVEGNFIRRLVSVADGVSVQGAGQGVKINIYDVSPHAPIDPANDGAYTASVNVVRGTRGSTSNPPTYVDGQKAVVLAGAQAQITVPLDAGVVSVSFLIAPTSPAHATIPANAIRVSQRDDYGNLLASYDPRQYSWIPLVRGATLLFVDNDDAQSITATPIWGIDG